MGCQPFQCISESDRSTYLLVEMPKVRNLLYHQFSEDDNLHLQPGNELHPGTSIARLFQTVCAAQS